MVNKIKLMSRVYAGSQQGFLWSQHALIWQNYDRLFSGTTWCGVNAYYGHLDIYLYEYTKVNVLLMMQITQG